MTPEIMHRNRTILRKYKINDNVAVGIDPGTIEFGTVIGYTAHNDKKSIQLKIKMITVLPLRESDGPLIYTLDPDVTTIEHV